MEDKKDIIKSISFVYESTNNISFINNGIENLLNTNSLYSEGLKKMNIYRTEFYNLFINPKTKWLVDNNFIRLYIRLDYLKDTTNVYSRYIPIGIITGLNYNNYDFSNNTINIILKDKLIGTINADVYTGIINKFKGLIKKDGSINFDIYKVGYISCGEDIVAITLKNTKQKFESTDDFIVQTNKLLKFANDYIEENKLI